ncbi:hypothetical protein [Pseudacidovorax intermedius]|uniref:hypothetical protein n=1 Tax=Pseudacidovorax intermedius TaxID=433924 RepID=UPI0005C2A31F|nr:hypothetical protein [Pseudacidovorax intermedius]
MIDLDIFYPPATPERIQAALAAARAVLERADVDLHQAWLAEAAHIAYTESGCDDAYKPTEEEILIAQIFGHAQAAANAILGTPDGDPASLDFKEV